MLQNYLTPEQIIGFANEHIFYTGLFILMVIDVVTGVMAAFAERRVSSDVSRQGMMRKGMMWAVVLMSMTAGWITNFNGIGIAGVSIGLGGAAAAGFCITEILSILENAGRLGIMPPVLIKEALAKLNTSTETEVIVRAATSSTVETTVAPKEDSLVGGNRRHDPKR